MRISFRLAAAFVAATVCAGCGGKGFLSQERLDKGLVLILPGIEEHEGHSACIRRGLDAGGVDFALEIHPWHAGALGAGYAFDEAGARARAAALAGRVVEYREGRPGRPVFLVGHSGGGAIVIFAAEAMPAQSPVEGMISISPALGPKYDLTPAVHGCRGHLAVCYAGNDLLLRGLTTLGRNFDGSKGATAGQEGFSLPPDASDERREAFSRVTQIEWDSSMVKRGNWGGHFGWTNPSWVAATLAPLINAWAMRPDAKVSNGAHFRHQPASAELKRPNASP